jgi:hypothetical protein
VTKSIVTVGLAFVVILAYERFLGSVNRMRGHGGRFQNRWS